MKEITICLGFNDKAEEAAKFYTSIFPNSKITTTTHYGKDMPMPEGTVMTVVFELDGREYLALNGGDYFKFSEGISLVVNCETQEEIDHYWDALTDGGKPGPCGWLTDRFGVAWQITPAIIGKLLSSDQKKADAALKAVMTMEKIDIAAVQRAYDAA